MGSEMCIRDRAYPASPPIYSRNAGWYMADKPLTIDLETDAKITTNRNRIELVQFGSPSQMQPNDLVFVGTIEGSPIYAKRSDVAPFIARLQPKLGSNNGDLGTILRADTQLAKDFGAVTTYYVAVEPNCVFHPVSVTNYVRRTRG